MSWTAPADIEQQLRRLWDRGRLLAVLVGGESVFPRRLKLVRPTSRELAERFQAVRDWIADLDRGAGHYRVVMRTVNHRTLGQNSVPAEVWVDTLDDALVLLGREREAERFAAVVELTRTRQERLLPWLAKRPLKGLESADEWERLLDIVDWMLCHQRPGIYLRQVDIPGVHSKFIEQRRGVLTELLDLVMPGDAVDESGRGVNGFCRRYGFREKPVRIRFRMLDPRYGLEGGGTDQDITVTSDAFSGLEPVSANIFITENEINFLAFPAVAESMVVFGGGYGFEMLADVRWLRRKNIYYWGDIDTHGFAILDQLRLYFPAAASFLMDRTTLLAHRKYWGREEKPIVRELPRLTDEERELYGNLCSERFGRKLRLEQERVGYRWVGDKLAELKLTNR